MKLLGQDISPRAFARLLREAPLEDLMNRACAKQKVHFDTVRVGEEVLDCLQITDMQAYIDRQLELLEARKGVDALPLWAKIWPASLPLAMYMQRQTPKEGDRVLEIGAGLGLAGLFAARRGFVVVVSDNNPDALLFARINAMRNKLAHSVEVRFVDFVTGGHQGSYSHIIASEILFREVFFEPLLQFLRNHLRSDEPSSGSSEILLTADGCRRALKFFVAAKEYFHIARSAVSSPSGWGPRLGGDGQALQEQADQTIYVYRMKPL